MEELTTIIKDATAGIVPSYFHLNIDGGDPIYRERVYCYELYHQMRRRWPTHTDFCLNGEIDKAAHPILQTLGAAHSKPDLLVHQPGNMNGNYAIVEVKSPAANANGIRKDLVTLSLFKSKVGYQRAIYLIYGYEAASIGERVISLAKDIQSLESIELWLHQKPGEQATHNKSIHANADCHPRR